MQGGDAELNIYPDTIYAQHQNLGDGKLYRIYAASKEQLLSLGQSGAIGFSYLMTKPLDMVSAFPEVQIKNIDGKLISEVTCNQLPKTSLDKGTQRKTTENELPSLTQCTA